MHPTQQSGEPGEKGQVAKRLNTDPIFDAENIQLQRRMRFNPLRALDPENLSLALDQFEIGILRQAAMLWDAMCKRDDTLITVKPQLENSIASKSWGVFKKKGANEKEAARHAACLEYFYEHVRATDAFDRNERGGKERLIAQMMRADSFLYAVHHFVWKPQPGKMIEVEGAKAVPALTAELEYVPLWYFENTTGTLRFLPFGGFGMTGQEMDWENEWMVTAGRGLMFAASICYIFKRLTFQDWTIFNERYAQNKVVAMTNATKESDQGQALLQIVSEFNGDQGIAFFECGNMDKPPIQLLGPQGTASVDIFERFIDRQDRKLSSMFRGNDLSMMSRAGKGENPTGASLQGDEGDAMERGCCRMIAGALHEGIDRKVIRYCFGEGVEPLAYFGLLDMEVEDTRDLRESAGFLADRGAPVALASIADRLGVELSTESEEILQAAAKPSVTDGLVTPNSSGIDRDVALLVKLTHAALTANENQNHGPDGKFANGPGGKTRKVKSIQEVVEAAQAVGGPQVWTDYATVDEPEAKQIKGGEGRDFIGYQHSLDNEIVHKILRDHSGDPRPITPEDFAKLPDYIKNAESHYTEERDRKLERLIHVARDDQGRLMVVEEIRTGREKFTLKTMYRP